MTGAKSTALYTCANMDAASKPKRRNAPKTRARIIAAAQQAFAELGYPQAGIREIAAIAGVSSTLLLRYYGSKAGLFEAALAAAVPLDGVLAVVRRDKFGEHLARLILDPALEMKAPSIVALSTGDADARDIATRVTEAQVLLPLAAWLGPPDARARAMEIIMVAMGFVLYTRQLPLPAAQGMERRLGRWFAATVQAIVDRA
jgi:AcrR family transcriptional regulator